MNHSGMTLDIVPRATDPAALALTFLMWVVMMAAMMLPSAAPTITLYGSLVRRSAERGRVLPATWTFAAAYILVWVGFSAAATFVQAVLEAASLMSPAMKLTSIGLSGAALIAAGVYQFTPLKQACLRNCQNPTAYFITHWRTGRAAALRLGLAHGTYCLGCCWVLMLLLFVAGVMNLAWIALIAAFVFAEKLLPARFHVSHVAGAGLIIAGTVVVATA